MGKWLNGAREVRAAMDAAGAQLDDAAALDAMAIYPAWEIGAAYATNDRIRYGANLYKCVQAHTSQSDWTPDAVPALWVKVSVGSGRSLCSLRERMTHTTLAIKSPTMASGISA